MPTSVHKKGSRYVAVDRRSGKTLTKATTKAKAAAFGRIRDAAHKAKRKR